ncbi:MAG: FtsX-like permease family protein [Microbacterium sp.]|uniref:FtsX-like permease family protein n=1 Tax=Microbacterium sp. TaxID=51671 RepID=UPI003F9AE26C
MRGVLRSVFRINRASLVGTFVILALATALLTATGAWLQAGWNADEFDSGMSMLSALASSFAGTTLIIVVFIVASTVATALRRRRREFALLRSIGATAAQVRQQITAEVSVVVLAAAPVGIVAGILLAPVLTPLLVSNGIVPEGFVLPFAPLSIIATLAVMFPTALVAGRLAARESARLTPTAAVQQSGFEPATISKGRRIAAVATGVAGLLVAMIPFFFEGILGTASGASSVILLIVAVALAGPIIISTVATRAAAATASGAQPALVLAAVNARGFSRRNAAVIVPLALLLSLGAVQSGVGIVSSAATGEQLEQALNADLIVSGAEGTAAPDLDTVEGVPGVTAVAQTSAVRASVRVETTGVEIPGLDALTWMPTAIRTITPVNTELLDPGVLEGSLDDLTDDGTIAVSRDTIALSGKGIGDSVDIRLPGERDAIARIVAIYENSLGVGEYLMSPGDASAEPSSIALLVGTAPGSTADVRGILEADGALVLEPHEYSQAAQAVSGEEQGLSNVLLLALLAFIAVAALQSLATITSGRREEFELLRRSGATRPQLTSMVAVESLFVAAAALVLGVLAVLPALLGLGIGMLGNPLAAFDPVIFGGLAMMVAVLPMVTMVSVGWRSMTPQR